MLRQSARISPPLRKAVETVAAALAAAEERAQAAEDEIERAHEGMARWLAAANAAEAQVRELRKALDTISPEKLYALAALLDQCDERKVWWFEFNGDEVQRDLRLLADRAVLARSAGRDSE